MKQKVAIQYGIGAGQRLVTRLKCCLEEASYVVVNNSREADIIIAHSAGCFELPEPPTNQKLLLINPSYWPGLTAWQRGRRRIRTNMHLENTAILSYTGWDVIHGAGSIYFETLNEPAGFSSMSMSLILSAAIRNHKAILVRNDDDDWLTPDLDELATANPQLIIRRMPGDHDDILHNPAPYVALLKEL